MIDELGLEPGRALQELEAAILRHDAALDPRPAEATMSSVPVGAGAPRHESTVSRGRRCREKPVLGREEQLGQFAPRPGCGLRWPGVCDVHDRRRGGHRQDAGSPTSSHEMPRAAAHGSLAGRCWEAGGAPAYWPWVQVLRALCTVGENLDLRSLRGHRGVRRCWR